MEGAEGIILKIVTEAGPWGFIAWLLWWTMQRSLPKIVEQFREDYKQERTRIDSLDADLKKGVVEIIRALDHNLTAIRVLMTRLTGADFDPATGKPVCPRDGLLCSDPQRHEKQENNNGG